MSSCCTHHSNRSDPLHEDDLESVRPPTGQEEDAAATIKAEEEVEFKPNYERGCSYYFGRRAIKRFLDENGLLCLVRAHQVQEEGFRRHYFDPPALAPHKKHQKQQQHGSSKRRSSGGDLGGKGTLPLPRVITIFSAPNYAGRYGNKVTRRRP